MSTGPNNSSKPTTSIPVAGVYNVTPPAPADTQAVALQVDSQGNLKTTSSGGGGGNVNITGVNGSAPALTNPLPVELSDGTNAVGTAGNPLSVNVISGGGSNASVSTNGTAAPTSSTQVGGSDGTNLQPLQVESASNKNLRVGLYNGANEASVSAAGAVKVDGSAVTQPVSGTVTTTPPANASTNITQVGGSALSEGQKAMAASIPVVIASDQSAVPVSGTVTTTPPANASTNLTQVGGSAITEGQKAMASSLPVVIASDQSAVPISGTVTATPTADSTPATQNITAQDVGSTVSITNGNTQTFITGSPTAGSAASFALSSVETVQVQATGTWTGNFSSEVSYDGGTTWYYAPLSQTGNNFVSSQMPYQFAGSVSVGGATNYRVRSNSAGTGTSTIQIVKSSQPITDRPVVLGSQTATAVVISNATALNTLFTVNCAGYQTVILSLKQGSTVTAGVLTFEAADLSGFISATVGYPVQGLNTQSTTGGAVLTYTLQANTNIAFVFNVTGWSQFRVRLSTAMTGTGVIVGAVQPVVGQNSTLTAISGLNTVASVTAVTAAGVRSMQAASAFADNTLTLSAFCESNNTSRIMANSQFSYGGAFSGSADAARQGWLKTRTPTVFKTASVAATATGNSAVWTPGSGNKFRLLGFQITAQGLAATVSAVVTISFQDSASGITFGTFDVDVPAVAGLVSGVDIISGYVDMGAFGILSAAANNVLNFNISAAGAGTVGTYRINVAGTEE